MNILSKAELITCVSKSVEWKYVCKMHLHGRYPFSRGNKLLKTSQILFYTILRNLNDKIQNEMANDTEATDFEWTSI